MAGQTTDSGLSAHAIGRYFSYRLLVIPAVALLVVMTVYVALRSNRVYAFGVWGNEVNLEQQSLASATQDSSDFAIGDQDAGTLKGGGQQQVSGYAIQGNADDDDGAGTQGGYSNVTAMTASYVDWGAEDNGILSAFLGHLKKTLPEARGLSAAGPVVAGASEA